MKKQVIVIFSLIFIISTNFHISPGVSSDEHTYDVTKMAASKDYKYIATTSPDKTIKVWDNNFNLLTNIPLTETYPQDMVITDDNKYIVACLGITIANKNHNKIMIWKITGELVREIKLSEKGIVDRIDVSKDNKYIVISHRGFHLLTFEGKEVFRVIDGALDIYFINNDTQILTVRNYLIHGSKSNDPNSICIWDLKGNLVQEKKRIYDYKKGYIQASQISKDKKYLITYATNQPAYLMDLKGNILSEFDNDDLYRCTISPDNKLIAFLTHDKQVIIYDFKGKEVAHFRSGIKYYTMYFTKDSKKLILAGENLRPQLFTFKGETDSTFSLTKETDPIWSVGISNDNKILAWGSNNGNLTILNTKSGKQIKIDAYNTVILAVAVKPDGTEIVTAGLDNVIKVWDANGKLKHTKTDHTGQITEVVYSSDGKRIASCGKDGKLIIWNENWSIKVVTGEATLPLYSVNYNPLNKKLVAGVWSSTIKIVREFYDNGDQGEGYTDYMKGSKIIPGHQNFISSLDISDNQKYIVSGDHDAAIIIWDYIDKITLINRFDKAHDSYITTVRFRPGTSDFASSSYDGTVKYRNINGKNIKTYKEHKAIVRDLCFSFNGKYLISCADDRTVVIRNLKSGKTIKLYNFFIDEDYLIIDEKGNYDANEYTEQFIKEGKKKKGLLQDFFK